MAAHGTSHVLQLVELQGARVAERLGEGEPTLVPRLPGPHTEDEPVGAAPEEGVGVEEGVVRLGQPAQDQAANSAENEANSTPSSKQMGT